MYIYVYIYIYIYNRQSESHVYPVYANYISYPIPVFRRLVYLAIATIVVYRLFPLALIVDRIDRQIVITNSIYTNLRKITITDVERMRRGYDSAENILERRRNILYHGAQYARCGT